MLGHDLEMSCAKFLDNRFRIDGEIDKKHALQIILASSRRNKGFYIGHFSPNTRRRLNIISLTFTALGSILVVRI